MGLRLLLYYSIPWRFHNWLCNAGVTYGVASLMIAEGMEKEGFATAEGIYR